MIQKLQQTRRTVETRWNLDVGPYIVTLFVSFDWLPIDGEASDWEASLVQVKHVASGAIDGAFYGPDAWLIDGLAAAFVKRMGTDLLLRDEVIDAATGN